MKNLSEAKAAFVAASEVAAKDAAVASASKARAEAAKAMLWYWVDAERKNGSAVAAADKCAGCQPVAPPAPVAQPAQQAPSSQPPPSPAPQPQGATPFLDGSLARVVKKPFSGRYGPSTKFGVLVQVGFPPEDHWLNTFKADLGQRAEELEGKDVRVYYTPKMYKRKDGSDGQELVLEGVYPAAECAPPSDNPLDEIPF